MEKVKKVLFIASHRFDRAPAQRFRFEQYFSFLESQGIHCELSSLIHEKQDYFIYKPGHLFKKFWLFSIQSKWIRSLNLLKLKNYDAIFVNREALLTGSIFFEKQFAQSGIPLLFDFDDAIWKPNVSEANKRFAWLKNPAKTARIIALADTVIAGNQYLAGYARQFNTQVRIIPTTINTNDYIPRSQHYTQNPVCIGWSGSVTTMMHFKSILPVLYRLKEHFGPKVCFRLIGDDTFEDPFLELKGMAWASRTEVQDLHPIDIGIMPLPDDEWSKGKCGLKGLQYMALEIPTLMSPVGVNTEIITHGVNGFLPRTEEEWFEQLKTLVENPDLRINMGIEARKTVVEKYSTEAWKNAYLDLFR